MYGMEDNDQVLCVTWKEFITTTYTIVRIDFSGQKSALKCSSCKKSDCKHCKAVYTQSMNPDGLLLETLKTETKWRSRYVPVPVSKDKIPFANDRKSCIPLTVLKPNADGSCPECQSPWSLEVDEAGESVKIYTRCEILNATGTGSVGFASVRCFSTIYITVKFQNFWTAENFAIIYLNFKERGQILRYFIKKVQME